MTALRVILSDQLSESISALHQADKKNDLILMCEVHEEATYVHHHKKKLALLFSAMRHFAKALQQKGYSVIYVKLTDQGNTGSVTGEVKRAVQQHAVTQIVITEPSEYRLLKQINSWHRLLSLPVEICEDDRFLCGRAEFSQWATGRKQLRMEYFYREMRKKYHIMMDDAEPIGGKWNYDADNRKPPTDELTIPTTYRAKPDAITREVLLMVAEQFADHFGALEPFHFAVTRKQALNALQLFITERLAQFGDYQDAMLQREPWMYHSHISFYLNCGLLLPLECVVAAERAYRQRQAPLNAVEGFIRQIIGWREYIRGIYWLKMPSYSKENFFNANAKLPAFYWNANTDMNCLRQCISDTEKHAYAHHIQRLMVLGNFALLAGIKPEQVNEWFLVVYADAYEWVELPNVSGMILFADGGYLASKPYAAGGAYINKMSDYCQGCGYKVKQKNGPEACPFNYLYWDFLVRNRDKLNKNPRLAMVYRTLDRMSAEKKQAIQADSKRFLASLKS